MTLDTSWKHVCDCDGYRQIKEAYIREVRHPSPVRPKKELHELFMWVCAHARLMVKEKVCPLEYALFILADGQGKSSFWDHFVHVRRNVIWSKTTYTVPTTHRGWRRRCKAIHNHPKHARECYEKHCLLEQQTRTDRKRRWTAREKELGAWRREYAERKIVKSL
jgi:hypothetical protein